MGEVGDPAVAVPIGEAAQRRSGNDLLIVGVGVGAHRSLEAAAQLADDGIDAAVLDLRTVAPLDVASIVGLASDAGSVLVVDEDYLHFGLAGEVAAVLAEAGAIRKFARVGPTCTIPYARHLADAMLPSTSAISDAARTLVR
jgi:pyruvate/2-oxoglutarate/acetoin dehydrogenase E1 component